jgi:hypothetical protein
LTQAHTTGGNAAMLGRTVQEGDGRTWGVLWQGGQNGIMVAEVSGLLGLTPIGDPVLLNLQTGANVALPITPEDDGVVFGALVTVLQGGTFAPNAATTMVAIQNPNNHDKGAMLVAPAVEDVEITIGGTQSGHTRQGVYRWGLMLVVLGRDPAPDPPPPPRPIVQENPTNLARAKSLRLPADTATITVANH